MAILHSLKIALELGLKQLIMLVEYKVTTENVTACSGIQLAFLIRKECQGFLPNLG